MGKTTKSKVAKSLSKSRSDPGSKQTGHVRQKTATAVASEAQKYEASPDEVASIPTLKTPARVVWDKYPECMKHLLDFLDAHPDVAIKLFRDSTQTAKSEGRSKLTTKLNKGAKYLQFADGVFFIDNDPGVRADFVINPSKYTKAVNNYIIST